MITAAKTLEKYHLRATDGAIGHVKDVFVDDQHWSIRFFVVEVGSWLNHQKVLISPAAVTGRGESEHELVVQLTRDQVRNSPLVDTEKPVSRQHEAQLYQYYGWTPYWSGFAPFGLDMMAAATGLMGVISAAQNAGKGRPSDSTPPIDEAGGDPHLRSANELIGSTVHGSDAEFGRLDDFVVDDQAWRLSHARVELSGWHSGAVLLPLHLVSNISWVESRIQLATTRDHVRALPLHDSSQPLTPSALQEVDQRFPRIAGT